MWVKCARTRSFLSEINTNEEFGAYLRDKYEMTNDSYLCFPLNEVCISSLYPLFCGNSRSANSSFRRRLEYPRNTTDHSHADGSTLRCLRWHLNSSRPGVEVMHCKLPVRSTSSLSSTDVAQNEISPSCKAN